MDSDTLWCIHIPGPDEVYAQASKESAEQAAAEHNEAIDRYNLKLGSRGLDAAEMRAATAVVIPWPHSPENHANNLRPNIEE